MLITNVCWNQLHTTLFTVIMNDKSNLYCRSHRWKKASRADQSISNGETDDMLRGSSLGAAPVKVGGVEVVVVLTAAAEEMVETVYTVVQLTEVMVVTVTLDGGVTGVVVDGVIVVVSRVVVVVGVVVVGVVVAGVVVVVGVVGAVFIITGVVVVFSVLVERIGGGVAVVAGPVVVDAAAVWQ